MPTTSKFGLPYPALSDPPSGPVAVQNLAQGIDALGVVGGKRRTAAGTAISSIETIVVDTQTLALAANSVFKIEFYFTFTASVAGNDADIKIRMTSVAGTILAESTALGVYVTPQPNYGYIQMQYKTSATAELDYFCGTAIHVGTGTGTITPGLPTSILVTNLGPNTIVGDY